MLGASSSASAANGPMMPRPKMKLACRLAHSTISSASSSGGALPSRRAASSRPVQNTSSGVASMCGRANRNGCRQAKLSAQPDDLADRPHPELQLAGDQREGGPGAEPDQQHHPAPAAGQVGQRHQHFGAPLVGDPGLAGVGEGERIGQRHGVVRQDPAPGRDVPVGVAVDEHPRRERRHRQQHDRRRAGDGQVDRSPAGGSPSARRGLNGCGDGNRHGPLTLVARCPALSRARVKPGWPRLRPHGLEPARFA